MRAIAVRVICFWVLLLGLTVGLGRGQAPVEAEAPAQAPDVIRPVCVTIAGAPCAAQVVKLLDDQQTTLINAVIAPLYGGISTTVLGARSAQLPSDVVQSGRLLTWANPPSDFENGQLYVYDLDRGPSVRVVADVPQRSVGFDSTNTYVFYLTDPRVTAGLFRVRVDGEDRPEPVGLTSAGAILRRADVLPGDRIVASTSENGQSGQVFLIEDIGSTAPRARLLASIGGVASMQNVSAPRYQLSPDGTRLVWIRDDVLYARSLVNPNEAVVRLSPISAGRINNFSLANGWVAFDGEGDLSTVPVPGSFLVPITGPSSAAQRIAIPGPAQLSTSYLSAPTGRYVVVRRPFGLYAVDTAQPTTLITLVEPSSQVTVAGLAGEQFVLYTTSGGNIFRVPLGGPSTAAVAFITPTPMMVSDRTFAAFGEGNLVGIEGGRLYELLSGSTTRREASSATMTSARAIAAVSTDQRLVVFTTTNGSVYVWDRTGGAAPTPAATGTARPTVTPSPIPGTATPTPPPALTPITGGQESLGNYALINAGNSVIYTVADTTVSNPTYTLYRRDLNGAPQALLSPFPITFSVSADEHRLIYTVLKQGSTTEIELRSLDLTGPTLQSTLLASGVNLIRARFTSDSATVLFVMGGELWTVPADGSVAAQRLSNGFLYNLGFGLLHAYSYTGGDYVLYALNGTGPNAVPVWIVPVAGPASAAQQVGTINIDNSMGGVARAVGYPRIAGDGSAVAYVAPGQTPGTFQVFSRLLGAAGIGASQAISAPFARMSTTLDFGPGDDSVIFAAAEEPSGLGRAYQVPVIGPASATQLLTPPSVLESSIVAGRYHAATQSILLSDEAGMVYQIAAGGQTTPARQVMANGAAFWTAVGDQVLYYQPTGYVGFQVRGELRRVSLTSLTAAGQLVSPLTCQVSPLRIGNVSAANLQDYLVSAGNDRVGYVCADGQGGSQIWSSTLNAPVSVVAHLSDGITPVESWNGLTDTSVVLLFSSDAQRAFVVGRTGTTSQQRKTLYTTRAGAPPTAPPPPSPSPTGGPGGGTQMLYLPSLRK